MIKRISTIEDAKVCDELYNESLIEAKRYDDTIDPDLKVVNHFTNIINNPNDVVLAHVFGRHILAYIYIKKINDTTLSFDSLYVRENFRNRGIATGLINEAIKVGKNLKYKHIDVKVISDDEAVKKLYKKFGFHSYEDYFRKEI